MNTYYFTEGKFYKKVNIIKYQGDILRILQDFSGNIILRKDYYITISNRFDTMENCLWCALQIVVDRRLTLCQQKAPFKKEDINLHGELSFNIIDTLGRIYEAVSQEFVWTLYTNSWQWIHKDIKEQMELLAKEQ